MKNRVILEVKQTKDLSYLKGFGEIVFEDSIIDIVVLETDEINIPILKQHPEILNVLEDREGSPLMEKKSA
ncbi:hypothetical protein [Psychrobacillus psychrotolerans]|uniref:hypothetical protein n=1 Tax=Psychrobacillus psychrotolerans TaxID=126156 RepID=UPI003C71EF6F